MPRCMLVAINYRPHCLKSVPDNFYFGMFQIVDLDVKRNMNREALSALRNEGETSSEKVKVCFGNMFIKLPKKTTREMIQKDQEQLEKEISDIRKRLKAKVNHLNELQGKPELTGYSLSPLSKDEMKAIKQMLMR
uniref:p53 and DNA damage-regulated protein 1 n=1 Tax=Paramormyrops kingsleyae TaxID=1676925 RepID=A0A3B3RSI1_9TELE